MQQNIIAADGEWFLNTSTYAAFVDPTNGARFEPGVPTKAVPTDWVKGQPVLKPWIDTSDAAALAQKEAEEAAAAAEAAAKQAEQAKADAAAAAAAQAAVPVAAPAAKK